MDEQDIADALDMQAETYGERIDALEGELVKLRQERDDVRKATLLEVASEMRKRAALNREAGPAWKDHARQQDNTADWLEHLASKPAPTPSSMAEQPEVMPSIETTRRVAELYKNERDEARKTIVTLRERCFRETYAFLCQVRAEPDVAARLGNYLTERVFELQDDPGDKEPSARGGA